MSAEVPNQFQRGVFIQEDDGNFALVIDETSQRLLPVERIAKIFAMLGEPSRLSVVLALIEPKAETNVGQLCKMLGVSQPTLSHHLMLLRPSGLLDFSREGKNNYYFLANREELTSLFLALLEALTGQKYAPQPSPSA